MNLKPGSVAFEKFKILSSIGEGGMASVYKARHIHLDKIVVLKLLKTDTENEKTLVRFHSEAKILSQLKHPGISQFFDFGLSKDNEPYLAIEFVEGKTLKSILKEVGILPVGLAVSIILEICQTLSYAHKKGIIHRDVKPANIMLQESEGESRTILLDFGIARLITADKEEDQSLTSSGELVGSPRYMSPEQAEGKAIDRTTDLYSLGCILFEMLSGDTPLTGESVLETINLRKTESAPALSSVVSYPVSEELDEIIARMLARVPEERYKSIEPLIDDLTSIKEKLLESDSEKEKTDASDFALSLKVKEPLFMRKSFILSTFAVALLLMATTTYLLVESGKSAQVHKASSSNNLSWVVHTGEDKKEAERARANSNNLEISIKELKDLDQIDKNENLQILKLRIEEKIDLDGLKKLQNIDSLIELYIYPNQCTLDSLKSISSLTRLVFLQIQGMSITKEALKDLAEARNLQVLNLVETGLTAADLKILSKIKPLKLLYLDSDLGNTKELEDLRSALPDCSVTGLKVEKEVPSYAHLFDGTEGARKDFFIRKTHKEVFKLPSKLFSLKEKKKDIIDSLPDSKRHQKLFELSKKCYEIATKAQGKSCPAATNYLSEMSTYKQVQGKYEEALAFLDKSDATIKENKATRYSSSNKIKRSDIYWIQGKGQESIATLEDALVLSKMNFIKQDHEPLRIYERLIQRLSDMNEIEKAEAVISAQKKYLKTWHPRSYPYYGYYCIWPLRFYYKFSARDPKKKEEAIAQAQEIRKRFYALKEEADNKNKKGRPTINDDELYANLEATFTLNCLTENQEERKKLLQEAARFIRSNPQMIKRNPNMAWDIFINLARLSKESERKGKVIELYKTAADLAKNLGPESQERCAELAGAELNAYIQSHQSSGKDPGN